MEKGRYETTMTPVKGSNDEYIIKDVMGITIGRVYIIEYSLQNEYSLIRIKFYKQGKESYGYLRNSLLKLLSTIFNNRKINKINIIVDEDKSVSAFTDMGFTLEGIITNSSLMDNVFKDEYLFAIDNEKFKEGSIDRNFTLKGERIELRLLRPDNAEEMLNYYNKNKKHLMPFEPSRDNSFYTLQVQKHILMEGYRQFLSGTAVNFGIYLNGNLIGKIQMSNVVLGVFRSAFVGYSISEEKQGKGYMKEALRLFIDFAFNEMGLHRLEASTLVDNIRSQKVLEGCGFKFLGINEKYLYINGEWRDHKAYYLISGND